MKKRRAPADETGRNRRTTRRLIAELATVVAHLNELPYLLLNVPTNAREKQYTYRKTVLQHIIADATRSARKAR